MSKQPSLSERMRGNTNACKGYPTKPNRERYPLTDGFPLLCDGCHVGRRCPKFEAGGVCAFRTEFVGLGSRAVDVVYGELQALARVQKSRLMCGLMYEQLNGGVPDPAVGQEVDGMRRCLERLAKLQKGLGLVATRTDRA